MARLDKHITGYPYKEVEGGFLCFFREQFERLPQLS
jgi:hypothetical protein